MRLNEIGTLTFPAHDKAISTNLHEQPLTRGHAGVLEGPVCILVAGHALLSAPVHLGAVTIDCGDNHSLPEPSTEPSAAFPTSSPSHLCVSVSGRLAHAVLQGPAARACERRQLIYMVVWESAGLV